MNLKKLFERLSVYAALFLIIQTFLRLTLLVRGEMDNNLDLGISDYLNIFLRGLWLDIATAPFVLIPITLITFLVPERFWNKWAEYGLRFVFLYVICFDFVAEHVFWTEFSTRFNFIAVDYLVYTQEVIGNIVESYPLAPLLAAIGVVALVITWAARKVMPQAGPLPAKMRMAALGMYALLTLGLYAASNTSQSFYSDNAEAGEIAANGIYNLFYAFWHNEISYDRFYAQRDREEVKKMALSLLAEKDDAVQENGEFVRIKKPHGPEKHKNVILVVMESMSADFMGTFGNEEGLTPNLDKLAREGLFFSDTYATGTRTVRGLEAVTLSVPPTPGQSIVRRPGNENLFSLGFVFKDRGYDTTFLYGGYGYFDNMNAFFAGNGFNVIDRTAFDKSEYAFANVWGIPDDDVFARAVREADKSVAAGKPFMQLIMTTSNHRPYTYEDGRIDIPSGTGRSGGVKYADYSVGKLLEFARSKPWFKDTIFVFVADHTAGAGGKVEMAPVKYHIPMIFYAPGIIKPHNYKNIASQIDLAPILLGQLNFHYRSKFYGEDLMHDDDEIPHAFISNYQKVALVKSNVITVLSPKKQVDQYTWPDQTRIEKPDNELIEETISYYQSASWWRDTLRRVPSTLEKAQ
ncbi:MAG: sulfatase-like hydrolase/transferase [Alphaproteobacteria bacterium]|nr:sulfatase-like hydrolase/transferase [Alphaproteobacteria bacterium]